MISDIFKWFLSLSLSGGIIALFLLVLNPFTKNKFSKTWHYYIWLIVFVRLIVPFAFQINVADKIFSSAQQYDEVKKITPDVSENEDIHTNVVILPDDTINQPESDTGIIEPAVSFTNEEMQFNLQRLLTDAGLLWLIVCLVLFGRKIKSYLSFVCFVKNGAKQITDDNVIEIYHGICEKLGIKKPIPLYSSTIALSPMCVGFFKPCIVLPSNQLDNHSHLNYIFRHELTHYKRLDIYYKWLIQLVICVHWYNPVVYFIGRKVNRLCELSCDESVIKKLDAKERRAYGDTLLRSLELSGHYSNAVVSLTLSENSKLMKERLGAIMKFHKTPKIIICFSSLLAVILCTGAMFTGVYAQTNSTDFKNEVANVQQSEKQKSNNNDMKISIVSGKKFYLIENELQLRAIGAGKYSMGNNYILDSNITLTSEWHAIGNDDSPFTGSFNGNGFKINNMKIKDKNVKYAGLFGYAEGATIYNVTLANVDISVGKGKNKHVGAIVALMLDGKVFDCKIENAGMSAKDQKQKQITQ